jgi:hypothetical protein
MSRRKPGDTSQGKKGSTRPSQKSTTDDTGDGITKKPFLQRTSTIVTIISVLVGIIVAIYGLYDNIEKKRANSNQQQANVRNESAANANKSEQPEPIISVPPGLKPPRFTLRQGDSGEYQGIRITVTDLQSKNGKSAYQVSAKVEVSNKPPMNIRQAEKNYKVEYSGFTITVEDVTSSKATFSLMPISK